MPCIIRNDALDFIPVNMYGSADTKICYAFGVDLCMASAWCFWREAYLLPVFDMVYPLYHEHSQNGQNNGNSCERYTFLYYGPPFACNTAFIHLGIDLYKF